MMCNLRPIALGILCASVSLPWLASTASAAGTIKIDDTKWISVGAGLRTSFNAVEDAAPSGNDWSNDFRLDSVRLYVNGQIHENIKFEFNTERQDDGNGDDDIRVLDAIAKFEFSDLVNVWAGRMLPPSDRSNLDGPYYLSAWNFPLAQAYPSIFAGRDDGAAFWGQVNGGQFKYQVGAFQGTDGLPNEDDNLLYAGRLTYNFWDPEPGYYNSSTYYGAKDILAIGVAFQTQSDSSTNVLTNNTEDFTGWSVDGLMEKKLGNSGVVTLESTYYDYEGASTLNGLDGTGYFVLGAYLFPQKIGIGRIQPIARYQNLDVDNGNETDNWELGVNYIIDAHNARVSLVYSNTDIQPDNGPSNDFDALQLGVQLQI